MTYLLYIALQLDHVCVAGFGRSVVLPIQESAKLYWEM